MYNNPYVPNYYNNGYNQQNINERIDNQIAQLNQMKEQLNKSPLQQPAINQTFQLAPNGTNTMKYVNTIDDVGKEVVYGDTPFFSKDMSILWIKNSKNEIRTYELKEIIPKDNKDLQIEYLQAQIEELKKGMIRNESNVNVDESNTNAIESEKSTNVSTIPKPKTKSKQSTGDIKSNDK